MKLNFLKPVRIGSALLQSYVFRYNDLDVEVNISTPFPFQLQVKCSIDDKEMIVTNIGKIYPYAVYAHNSILKVFNHKLIEEIKRQL